MRVANGFFSLEKDSGKRITDQLCSSDAAEVFQAVEFLKNVSIGSNRKKDSLIELGLVDHLLELLKRHRNHPELQNLLIEIVAILNSLAKGTDEHCQRLIDLGVIDYLLNIIMSVNSSAVFIEITLKTIRSLFNYSFAPVNIIYEWDGPGGSEALIQRLLELPMISSPSLCISYSIQECVFNILSKSLEPPCKEKQCLLKCKNAIPLVANSLSTLSCKVKLAALDFLARVTYQNDEVSRTVVITPPSMIKMSFDASSNGSNENGDTRKSTFQSNPIVTVPDILTQMMSQECSPVMQLSAAQCMAYLYRAGAICPEDKRIVYKTLPTLVRSCKADRDALLRAEAAKVLAYLTEVDTNLQLIAAQCDQVIPTIASLLRYSVYLTNSQSDSRQFTHDSDDMEMYCSEHSLASATTKRLEREELIQNELMQAAFRAFASLGANDEDIRKKIFETDGIIDHVISGLKSPKVKIRIAALKCLHSLSRSVNHLRTSFQDQSIWGPLRSLLNDSTGDVLTLVSSTLCNLLSEYPPGKPNILNDRSTIEQLCALTTRQDATLRVNGIWALMNMAIKADQNQKTEILRILTLERIFTLLEDNDNNLILKTLGLLRNLLTTKSYIDHVMMNHGKDIFHHLGKILNSHEKPNDVKEQALCVLANIATGDASRDLIMANDDILNKLNCILEEDEAHVRLQLACAYVITNLAWAEHEGFLERQIKLREIGVYKNLDNLVTTSDTELFDKVKTALHQFSH